MINGMRRCVACDDPWPWPISSRSFSLDLENRVRSVASTILDGFFLYLAQMITIIRGCVACYLFFRIWKFEFLVNLKKKKFGLDLEKKSTVLDGFFPYLAQVITSMRGCVAYNELWPWPWPWKSCPLCSVVWNTECSRERGPEWAGMLLRRVWLESAQERPWKPGVLRPGSALLARERGLSGRALPVCWIGVCIGIVYWSCVRPGFACPDPSCVYWEHYQPSCVCDGAVCADVRCVWSSIWAYKGRMATVSGVHCR